ncbi:MAG: SET domain-containing protein-lysine N-methyltransferase [Luteitalea sp.]|nr:SET domain-containing protein-lysine N-methyltransferase [Luteitalea sp.]
MGTNGSRPRQWSRRPWLERTKSEAAYHAQLNKGRLIVSAPPRPDAPPIARRRSRVHGWGVFALAPISKNKRIVEYAGELVQNARATPRETRYLKDGCIWCFQLNRLWVIDAGVGGNIARFINHSCQPNCHSRIEGGLIWICASRTIKAGEELSYNYFTEGAGEIPCRCRAGCQNML